MMEFGYFAKLLIDIDLADPIPSKILVEVEDGDFLQRVELGATPKFCSHCKIIGHTFVECRVIKEQVQRVEDPKKDQQEILVHEAFTKNQKKCMRKKNQREVLNKEKGLLEATNDIRVVVFDKMPNPIFDAEVPDAMSKQMSDGEPSKFQELGNLWCLWKAGSQDLVLVAASSQHITLIYEGVLISTIHGMASISARRGLWKDMENFANLNHSWLALWDFLSCIRSWDERSGGTGPLLCSITEFNDSIDSCRLSKSSSLVPGYQSSRDGPPNIWLETTLIIRLWLKVQSGDDGPSVMALSNVHPDLGMDGLLVLYSSSLNDIKKKILVAAKDDAGLSGNSMANNCYELQIVTALGVPTKARPLPIIQSCTWALPWFQEVKINCMAAVIG
ncbi:hypothetical protein GIB67_030751 [Kingdonia uniflora]|uniref:DUF4283 domain-containing protein n=1 Tax=Kingdonia uniflora TaxID=39325 RepID=A0A7J7L328_9MAGN|nr:hypothetical protein GIB67_030751 [Kingdonia uniflora]